MIKSTEKERQREYYQKHKDRINNQELERVAKLKVEVLTHYGNDLLACVWCGFDDIRTLSIDHIDNDGAKERRRLGIKTSAVLWRRLRKQGYPSGYQTLCMNCQWIKRQDWYKENRKCVLSVTLGAQEMKLRMYY